MTDNDDSEKILRQAIDKSSYKQDIQKERSLGVKLMFPEEINGNPRIRYDSGDRLIDWEHNKWVCYVKESATWYEEDCSPRDIEVLRQLLLPS